MPWYDDIANPDKDPQANFEEHVVRRILQRAGGTADIQHLIERSHDGQSLTFYGLCEILDFPIWLVARRIPGLPTLEDDLLRRPTKTALFREFCAAAEEMPDELNCQAVGVVFPWAHVDRYNVFHTRLPSQFGKFGRWYRIGPHKQMHLLEPIDSLMDSLGTVATW